MVNEMNLKKFFLTAMLCCFGMAIPQAKANFKLISQRHHVVCGVNADYNHLARKQEGIMIGFYADLCRAIAQAILQDADSFKIKSVKTPNIGKLLKTGMIDVMFDSNDFSPMEEAKQNIVPIDVMYYDRIVFASRQKNVKASSMKDYAGQKVCVQDNSFAWHYVNRYNSKYALGFNFVKFPLLSAVKEAFYLNRCPLVVGDEVFIKSIVEDLHSDEAEVLPEEIGVVATRSYGALDNNIFNMSLKGIFSALKIAAEQDVTSADVETFKSSTSPMIQNILNVTPQLWLSLGLVPDWAEKYIKTYGNYTEILERNLGERSSLKLDMSHNKPYLDGGMMLASPLL